MYIFSFIGGHWHEKVVSVFGFGRSKSLLFVPKSEHKSACLQVPKLKTQQKIALDT